MPLPPWADVAAKGMAAEFHVPNQTGEFTGRFNLEIAPYLIAVFAQSYGQLPDGRKVKNYYVTESTGIATGMLITALHHSGLATLTHTPSPMNFLNKILKRPENERPFLLLVAGYPADDCLVPMITKKPLEQIATFV